MIREKEGAALPGAVMALVLLAASALVLVWFITAIRSHEAGQILLSVLAMGIVGFSFAGLLVVSPGEARVLQRFGTYTGTIKRDGFWWVNPFTSPRRKVSLRVRNFESAKLKVNDHVGNPIEIAAVVVWQVVDTAEAVFQVDDYNNFVKVQSESALRNLAGTYPYDAHVDGAVALRSHPAETSERLKAELHERLGRAGVEVLEARISHLAYAPEIASAMLRRQQASAIVAARQTIVEGAVGMVHMALEKLSAERVVTLDEERKAAMVSNLLVVLCSDQHTQPVVNTGTLYTG